MNGDVKLQRRSQFQDLDRGYYNNDVPPARSKAPLLLARLICLPLVEMHQRTELAYSRDVDTKCIKLLFLGGGGETSKNPTELAVRQKK